MGNFYPPAFGVAVKIFSTAFKVYCAKLIGVERADMLRTRHKKCNFVSRENYATPWIATFNLLFNLLLHNIILTYIYGIHE